MSAPKPNLIDELSRAAEEPGKVIVLTRFNPSVLISGALSLLIHAIITFNALVFHFPFPESTQAQLKFAKGEAAQAVEVQLTLMMPAPKPTPVLPDALPPKEPVTPPVAPVPPKEKVEKQKPEPFEQTPPPKREPVDGGVEGRSPLADRVLKDDAVEASEPEPVDKQDVEQFAQKTPQSDAFDAAAPKPAPRQSQPTVTSPVPTQASKAGSKTPAPAMPVEVTFAAAPPTIEFTPTLAAPPTVTPPPTTAAVTPPTQTSSRVATQGVSSGVEAELVKPRYPKLSIRAGEEGTIILEIEVLPDGSVGFVRVIDSPGYDRLEQAAIDAVKRSRFTPALRDGSPIREVVRKSIRFRLQDA